MRRWRRSCGDQSGTAAALHALAIAVRIIEDWPAMEPRAAQIEQELGENPLVAYALGLAYYHAGKLDDAVYVERATWGQQRIEPLASVDPSTVPYFSLALLPSPAAVSTTQRPVA